MGIPQTIEHQRSLRNNDPLAHVYLLQDSFDDPQTMHRIRLEFITDMGERLENQPFMQSYSFSIEDDEIMYDTGLHYMASLQQSFIASQYDVSLGSMSTYHVARQGAFLQQGKKILEWANGGMQNEYLVAFSLCPQDTELHYTEAKKQSFKPDRLMASVQLHAMSSDNNGETIAFSLDGLTLERLQALYDSLGIAVSVADTTLEQLTVPILVPANVPAKDAAHIIISTYDKLCERWSGDTHQQGISIEANITEANEFVASHPEAYELYKTIIHEVAQSLNSRVTGALESIIHTHLAAYYHKSQLPDFLALRKGDYLDAYTASNLIDYLRKQAIPEYLSRILHQTSHSPNQDTSYNIGSSGVLALQAGRHYDGACPSTNASTHIHSVDEQSEQFGIKRVVVYEVPKPIMSKGDYDVLPIGSCPVCGTECGTGIKHKKTGRWYCTQRECRAYKEEVYNFVFGVHVGHSTEDSKQSNTMLASGVVHSRSKEKTNNIGFQLRQCQNQMWLLKSAIYNEEMPDIERTKLVFELVQTYQTQQELLRASLGYVTTSNL